MFSVADCAAWTCLFYSTASVLPLYMPILQHPMLPPYVVVLQQLGLPHGHCFTADCAAWPCLFYITASVLPLYMPILQHPMLPPYVFVLQQLGLPLGIVLQQTGLPLAMFYSRLCCLDRYVFLTAAIAAPGGVCSTAVC
jgi:hypothetical protein